jgi:hypothetical protein
MPRLKDRLNEFKKSFESGATSYNISREAVETMHRARRVEGLGRGRRGLKVVDTAPSFTLFSQDDVRVSSGPSP